MKYKNDASLYAGLNDENKKKFWDYGTSQGLVPTHLLGDKAKAEMNKYTTGDYKPELVEKATGYTELGAPKFKPITDKFATKKVLASPNIAAQKSAVVNVANAPKLPGIMPDFLNPKQSPVKVAQNLPAKPLLTNGLASAIGKSPALEQFKIKPGEVKIDPKIEAKRVEKERKVKAKAEYKGMLQEMIKLNAVKNKTPEQMARSKQLSGDLIRKQGEVDAMDFGIASKVPGVLDAFGAIGESKGLPTGEAVDIAREQKDFRTGEVLGTIGTQLATYAAAGKVIKAIPAVAKVAGVFGQLGTNLISKLPGVSGLVAKLGAENTAKFIGQQGVDFLIDRVVQEPQAVFKAIEEDQTLDEYGKGLLKRGALDIVFNLAIGAGGEVVGKAIRDRAKASMSSNAGVEQMRQLGVEPDSIIRALDGDAQAIKEVQDIMSTPRQALQSPTPKLPDEPTIDIEIPRTVDSGQPVRSQGADIIDDSVSMNVNIPRQIIPSGPPINTKEVIAQSLPREGRPLVQRAKENLFTGYQEFVNKNAPFDVIQKKTGVETGVKASNINRLSGAVDYQIAKAQTNLNGEEIGKSLSDVWNTNIERSELMDYALNRHNINRYAEGKPVFGDTVTSEVSAKTVADYEANNPGIKEAADDLVKYMSNLLDIQVKSGLASQELADTLRTMYPNYLPTYRAKDISKAMGNNAQFVANVIKKAKGGESTILPIDQQMAIMTNKTLRAAHKNELMNALDEAYQLNPDGVSKYIKGITDVAEDTPKSMLEIGQGLERELIKDGDSYLVTYYKDGVPKQMKVNQNVYNAMTSLDFGIADDILSVISKGATTPFKQLITQKNPFFAVKNIMRDIPTALVYSPNPLKLIASVPEAMGQMKNNGPLWKQYQALGGTRSGLFSYDKGANLMVGGESALKKVGNVIEAPGAFTETVPRFSEYIRAIKAGDSPAVALMRSAELTTDFARHGRAGKKVDAVVPYFNAGLQGMDKFMREMYKNPLKTAAKAGVVVTLPTAILDQVNKNNPAYNEMSSRERNMYYHIPIPGSEEFARVPRSRETGVIFGNAFEWLAKAARGQEVTPEEIKSTVIENFTPAGFDSAIWKPASNFMDIWTGKDPDAKNYFGANIIPESLQKYSPDMQFDEKTSSLSKSLGAYLDISPKSLDYLFDSYLGILADVGLPLMTDKKSNALKPFKNIFIADPVFKSDALNKFYDRLESTRMKGNDLNKKFDIPSEVVNPYEKEASRLTKISKDITDINKLIKAEKDDAKIRLLREKLNLIANSALKTSTKDEPLDKQAQIFKNTLK